MTNDSQNYDDWAPCPPGALARLGARARLRTRARQTAISIGVVVALLVSVGVANHQLIDVYMHPGQTRDGGLWCSEVAAAIPQLVAGQLSEERQEQVEVHLINCPRCRGMLERMRKERTTDMSGLEKVVSHSECEGCAKDRPALLAALSE